MKLAYKINNLEFSYVNGFIFHIKHLQIEQGKILGVVGLNGSGKSTLLKLLAFLLPPNSSEMYFFNKLVTADNFSTFRRNTTLLLQNPVLLNRTVFDNIAYGPKIQQFKNMATTVANALEKVGLPFAQYANKFSHELSGGELKRVALAARIAICNKVLLLDEPTTNIDKINKELIMRTILELKAVKNTTIIVSSHDEAWLAKVSDYIVECSHSDGKTTVNHIQL